MLQSDYNYSNPMEEIIMDSNTVLQYKGRPLRRLDNLIYFGSMTDEYIIMMQILESKKIQNLKVATKVSVQLQLTDPKVSAHDRVVKQIEKDSLYAAMDLASVWLDRALARTGK